jgi:hypothetical protein
MAKRDPNVMARNKSIEAMKKQLRDIQSKVLKESGKDKESSLNAFIGSKADDFIDLKHEVITTPEEYVHRWLEGMKNAGVSYKTEIEKLLENPKNKHFRRYVHTFLKRSFLKHYNELY